MVVSTNLAVVPRRLAAWIAVAAFVPAIVATGLMHSKPAAADGDPCPCGLFASSALPGTANDLDIQAQQQGIELGVQFTSDVAGFISGIRFYKGSDNVGLRVGDVWDANGSRLNSVGQARSFSGETASGWQTLTFRVPVPIAANTTYIAAYHSNYGSYSSDQNFFALPHDAAPLHSRGGGGVYAYGGVQFPTSTFNSSNYWVDVVFDTHATPAIIDASPARNETGVSFRAQPNSSGALQAAFTEPVIPSSVHMELHRPDGSAVHGFVSYQQLMQGPSGVFAPTEPLAPGTTYSLTVSQATDAAGVTMG